MGDDLNDRVRARLRDEMTQKHLSQQEVADLIGWTQSKVAQKLTGRTPITLDELAALCFAVGLPITEAVRDRGLEFCAEMLPHELRLLEHYRQQPQDIRDALLKILKVAKVVHAPDRYATPVKKSSKKPKGTLANDPRMTIADAD